MAEGYGRNADPVDRPDYQRDLDVFKAALAALDKKLKEYKP